MSSYCCAFCASVLANHVEVGEEFLPCYADTSTCAYPLHGGCRKIFARMLGADIESNALHKAMRQMCRSGSPDDRLSGIETKIWHSRRKCLPSNQLDTFKPAGGSDEIRYVVKQELPVDKLVKSPSPLSVGHKVRRDPFRTLPYDIVALIAAHLPVQDVHDLSRASWPVNTLLHNDSFWRQMIRRDFLPWFWEMDPLPEDIFSVGFDFRRVYGWLDEMTRGKAGGNGAFARIANRRKIWRVCERVEDVYWAEMKLVTGKEALAASW